MSDEVSAEAAERVGDGGRRDALDSTSPGAMVATGDDKQRSSEKENEALKQKASFRSLLSSRVQILT